MAPARAGLTLEVPSATRSSSPYFSSGTPTTPRSTLVVHDHEASACADLLRRVTGEEHVFFERVAGPAAADEADAAFDAWLAERVTSRGSLASTDWKVDDVPLGPKSVLASLLHEGD